MVLAGWVWLKRAQPLHLQWDRASQNELLRYSARSHPDLLFQQVILRSDYLFIGALLGSTALGHYAMASAAAELLLIVPEAVTTPLMKRLLQQDEGMDKVTPLALRLTATVMLGACLSMAVIGNWLTRHPVRHRLPTGVSGAARLAAGAARAVLRDPDRRPGCRR